tara:strand:+ start:2451 stop:3257 length:807 start_codon:yes stop_codon:yes gene_type:complete
MQGKINPLIHPFKWLEQKALFLPEKSFRGNPGHVGLDFSDIDLLLEDGIRLHGWHIPHPKAQQEGPVWLILHGNGGNISVRLDQYKELHDRYDAAVIAIDYRGYGKSSGFPSEHGLYADALAAYKHTQSIYPKNKIYIFGRSMGGAVASQLVTKVPANALILEASISSIQEIIKERSKWLRYFPLKLISSANFNTKEYVSTSKIPKLIFHGDSDKTVSHIHSERIYKFAREPKQLEIIAGGDHNGLDLVDPERYHAVLQKFLREHNLL